MMVRAQKPDFPNVTIKDQFTATDSFAHEGSLRGRVCRQMNNAGKAFCNLISQLWDMITAFFADNTPSERDLKRATIQIKRGCSDTWRNLKRFFTDLVTPPSTTTQIGRDLGDAFRDVRRKVSDTLIAS